MSSVSANLPSRLRAAAASPVRLVVAAVILLVVVLGAWMAWRAVRGPELPGAPATADQIAAQYGIRITHVAVLADGGLIDFRFEVIDADKSAPLFNLETRPRLIVEKTGQEVSSLYHPMQGHTIVAGQSAFFLYNDSHGYIKAGTSISVLIGTLRLEHIIAQ
jgi:hypothetical protein